MTNRSKQFHQSQHNHGFKNQTNLGRIVDGSTPKNRGIKQIITCRGGRVPESFHRSPCSVVAALVPLAQQMAERIHSFTDDASKHTGASPKPAGKGDLALASVGHQKSSLLISAQEKTQSDVQGQENRGQPSSDLIAFPRFKQESSSHGTRSGRLFLDGKERTAECIVVICTHRVPESQCPSIGRPIAVKNGR